MSIWTTPSPSDTDRWQALVLDGEDPSTAARQLGFAGSSAFRRADKQRHAEVLDLWRETQRAQDRKLARDTLREIAGSTNSSETARVQAADRLARASGYIGDKVELELSGPDGGPIEIEGGTSLADVARVLTSVGALPATDSTSAAGPDLPEPPGVLPDPQ